MTNNLIFSKKIIVNNSRSYCDCAYKHYQEILNDVLRDYKHNPYVNLTIQTKIIDGQSMNILGHININFVGIDKLTKITPFISYGSFGGVQSGFFDGFGFYYKLDENNQIRVEILMGKVYVNNIELGNLENFTNPDVSPIVDCNLTYEYYMRTMRKYNEIPLYITNKNIVISLIPHPSEINFNIIDVVPEL